MSVLRAFLENVCYGGTLSALLLNRLVNEEDGGQQQHNWDGIA